MINSTITTNVVNGRIDSNRSLFTNVINQYEGKTIDITIKIVKKSRSNRQNSYYWGVIVPIWRNTLLQEWGELKTALSVHEFLKYNCNYKEKVNESTGEIIKLSRSTTDNDTRQQEMFQEKCRVLIFEMFNIQIPLPCQDLILEL